MARAYLDSCVVIYLIQGPEDLSRTIRSALRLDEDDPPVLCISDLTRLECRVKPIREADDELLAQFDGLFSSRDVEWLSIQTEPLISPLSFGHAMEPRHRMPCT